jgi:tRNA pseudouridine55 synthase
MISRQVQNDRLREVSGLLLLNKKPGFTSFDALGEVKRALATRKVGHTGTLDKFAEGLLTVLAGRALKLSSWFTHGDKHYEAVVRFGAETDTLDPEGAVVAQAEIPSREAVEKVLPDFTGNILQAPPVYSAIHIDGKRASELARAGKIPEMKKRPVTIYALELLSWEPPFSRFHIHCSSGTYIRSLARDMALAVNSRAYLTGLRRTKVAGFDIADAVSDAGAFKNALKPIDKAVFESLGLPWFEVDKKNVQKIIQGKPLSSIIEEDTNSERRKAVQNAGIFCGNNFIAMIEKQQSQWKYGYVYARENDENY